MNNNYSLAIHGGAGTILPEHLTPEKEKSYHEALAEALFEGEKILKGEGSSLDAVERAVQVLEDCPLFNAGKGSVYGNNGIHETEASIMYGKGLQAGAAAGLQHIKNPISLAKKVLLAEDFVYLIGEGAETFAKQEGMEFVDQEYFHTEERYLQWQAAMGSDKVVLDHDGERKFGTVGAVALDLNGNLAAATSTGGLTNKRFGRLGDSSVVGSGTYANNDTCAISCTGYGEYFLRAVVAYDISAMMEYGGLSLTEACDKVVKDKLVKMQGEGGVIAVDAKGNIDLCFNSAGMYRGAVSSNLEAFTAIYDKK
ncbi:isoaspartyl peptidase/L-asparaginase family protein [Sediminitomix flava]|uniref:Isoaspartyl peptidase n=1 Tax=Sediminitomix flava TaxID=379075 RepID=A0A315ZF21_SEDFL|nr:isoaspartyl peptidase/L-asparaginase [Sediminitomix flava]PWJ44155.1 beta-aspartyl-peptidase (threonine type) [Sediminitomix flava]